MTETDGPGTLSPTKKMLGGLAEYAKVV